MKETFSSRMKAAMQKNNMKQVDLVEKTGIGKSAISQYLSGYCEPKQSNIYKIALALSVSEGWLMGYDIPMERQEENHSDVSSNKSNNYTVQDKFSSILDELTSESSVYYHEGKLMSKEDKQLLRITLENMMRMAEEMLNQKK